MKDQVKKIMLLIGTALLLTSCLGYRPQASPPDDAPDLFGDFPENPEDPGGEEEPTPEPTPEWPTPPPETTPTPVPVSLNRIWFAPNAGAQDTIEMFTTGWTSWAETRNTIDVFQFYAGNIGYDTSGASGCPDCGRVVYPNLRNAQAFSKLQQWGIKTAVEVGAVKPGSAANCAGTGYAEANLDLFQRVRSAGGRVDLLVLDEPLIGGRDCGLNREQIADGVMRFNNITRGHFRDVFPAGRDLEIGLVEAYPATDAVRIRDFIASLISRGQRPSFLHLDVDRNHIRNINMTDARLGVDLYYLYRYCQSEGIDFGIIFWGQKAQNEAEYRADVLAWIDKLKQVYVGDLNHIKFQSWESTKLSNGTFVKTMPNNLPETTQGKHTNLLLEGLRRLGL